MINLQFTLRWLILLSCVYITKSHEYFESSDDSETETDDDISSSDDSHDIAPHSHHEDDLRVGRRIPADRTDTNDPKPNCKNFADHIARCTSEARRVYNNTQNIPPLPIELEDWCKSIKMLAQCGSDWNMHCRDSSQRVNPESVKGHQSIVQSICDNDAYLERYKWNSYCIPLIAADWEQCYTKFKAQVDSIKSNNLEWTHYETHFQLCCIRAQFRHCTLQILTASCSEPETIVLQKFSVIVSEGEVFQNCEVGVVYEKCPGGDPRPSHAVMLGRRPPAQTLLKASARAHAHRAPSRVAAAVALCLCLAV